jgi:hypothetical protein
VNKKKGKDMNLHINLKKLAFVGVWSLSLVPIALCGLWPVVVAETLLIGVYSIGNKIITRL